MFPQKVVNVHASLLPRWRGAAPIQRALMAGDKISGVTLQVMVKKLDAGDIIGSREITLEPQMNSLKLHDHLKVLGADLLRREWVEYLMGRVTPKAQDPQQVSYAPKIQKSESHIDWSQTAQEIHNLQRGLALGPGTYTSFRGKKLKIYGTQVIEAVEKSEISETSKNGEIIDIDGDKKSLIVACGEQDLKIFEVQMESRQRMSVEEFLKGMSLKKGDLLGCWNKKPFLIAPSILSADFANLSHEIKAIEQAGANWIHIDVMDGHFVPNLTLGAPVVASLRKITPLPLDVHLMVEKPENYIEAFAKAGSNYLTIHVESTDSPRTVLQSIRRHKMKPGVTLRPKTPVDKVLPLLNEVDLVLIMTVEPGFGGQAFMTDQISKAQRIRQELEHINHKVLLSVDGGVNEETVNHCGEFDVLVAGNYIFQNDYHKAIHNLKFHKAIHDDDMKRGSW